MIFPVRTDVPLRSRPWMNWAIILAKWVFHGYSDWLIGGPPDPRGQPRVPITITTTASFGAAQQSTDLPLPPRDLRVLPIRLVLPSLFLGPARLKAS